MSAAREKTTEELESEPSELVTIGLFCTEQNVSAFPISSQIKSIEYIRKKITEAANQAEKQPPRFVLSMLLIPNWERVGNSYNDEDYQKNREEFFTRVSGEMQRQHCGFELKNAYLDASQAERGYLHQLKNNGANADWIKTHALVFNPRAKHLQLDSNTKIKDYHSFYAHTFEQNTHDSLSAGAHDGLNASAYDESFKYVSAHNKVVYAIPGGRVVRALNAPVLLYCEAHQDPHDPEKDHNSIYSKVFSASLAVSNI